MKRSLLFDLDDTLMVEEPAPYRRAVNYVQGAPSLFT